MIFIGVVTWYSFFYIYDTHDIHLTDTHFLKRNKWRDEWCQLLIIVEDLIEVPLVKGSMVELFMTIDELAWLGDPWHRDYFCSILVTFRFPSGIRCITHLACTRTGRLWDYIHILHMSLLERQHGTLLQVRVTFFPHF